MELSFLWDQQLPDQQLALYVLNTSFQDTAKCLSKNYNSLRNNAFTVIQE